MPDLGTYKELRAVLQTLQTLEDWKSSPEYEMITAQKEKVLSQLIRSFYHGLDSLSLRDTAWGDRDLPGMAFEVFRSLLGRKIWSWKPRHRSSGSGRGLSGRSDIFMKQTQKDCKHSIRLLMPQFIRLWITTIHGKIPLQRLLDRVGQYDFDLYAARDQIVSYIRKNEEIWPFSYTLILRASSAPYGAERQTPGDPNLYVDFIWWRVCDGGLRGVFCRAGTDAQP